MHASGKGKEQKNEGLYFEYQRVDPDAEIELPRKRGAEKEEFQWASGARQQEQSWKSWKAGDDNSQAQQGKGKRKTAQPRTAKARPGRLPPPLPQLPKQSPIPEDLVFRSVSSAGPAAAGPVAHQAGVVDARGAHTQAPGSAPPAATGAESAPPATSAATTGAVSAPPATTGAASAAPATTGASVARMPSPTTPSNQDARPSAPLPQTPKQPRPAASSPAAVLSSATSRSPAVSSSSLDASRRAAPPVLQPPAPATKTPSDPPVNSSAVTKEQRMGRRKEGLLQRLQGGAAPPAFAPKTTTTPAAEQHTPEAARPAAASQPASIAQAAAVATAVGAVSVLASSSASSASPAPSAVAIGSPPASPSAHAPGEALDDPRVGEMDAEMAALLADINAEEQERRQLEDWSASVQHTALSGDAPAEEAAVNEAAAAPTDRRPLPDVSVADVAAGQLLDPQDVAGALDDGEEEDAEDSMLDLGEGEEDESEAGSELEVENAFEQVAATRKRLAADAAEVSQDWRDIQSMLAELSRTTSGNNKAPPGGVSEAQAMERLRAEDPDLFEMLSGMEDGDLFEELMAEGDDDDDDDNVELSAEELEMLNQSGFSDMLQTASRAAGLAAPDADDDEEEGDEYGEEDAADEGEVGMSTLFEAIEEDPLLDEADKMRAAFNLQGMFNAPAEALTTPAADKGVIDISAVSALTTTGRSAGDAPVLLPRPAPRPRT